MHARIQALRSWGIAWRGGVKAPRTPPRSRQGPHPCARAPVHLELRVEPVRISIGARLHELLGVRIVDAAVTAVGVVVHEELHVRLLSLQPHRGARGTEAAAARLVRRGAARLGSRSARPPLPVRAAPPRLAAPRLSPRRPGGGRFPPRGSRSPAREPRPGPAWEAAAGRCPRAPPNPLLASTLETP